MDINPNMTRYNAFYLKMYNNVREILILAYLFGLILGAQSQSCAVAGGYCWDRDSCCGGCCRSNICMDTYDDCEFNENACLSYYCPPGMECYIYKPSCERCGSYPACKSAPE